jgi:serine/threonine protein kinase
VTHRDLKPQNIMLTRDGVKVLDFGLAKSMPKPGPADATLTASLTAEGMVMGTPQYMSPEQFEGKEADARSDIWAFGAVLYEMVTGRRAFQGKSHASLLGAILAADPAPMTVKPFTPTWLERLVRRCLSKDPEDRYYSLHDSARSAHSPQRNVRGPNKNESVALGRDSCHDGSGVGGFCQSFSRGQGTAALGQVDRAPSRESAVQRPVQYTGGFARRTPAGLRDNYAWQGRALGP